VRSLAISLFLYLVAAGGFAADPKIDNLAATSANGKVSAHFTLLNAFDRDEIVQGLQSGVPTSFAYIIEVYRDRPNWFDEGIDRSRIEVIATFNSVTREYLMNYRRDRKLVRSETFTDLETLEKRMTTIDESDLFDVGGRRPYKLRLRVKADLMRGWALYFIPWNFSTRWNDVRIAEGKP
jgi:Domain of unknown function (DUF4390)